MAELPRTPVSEQGTFNLTTWWNQTHGTPEGPTKPQLPYLEENCDFLRGGPTGAEAQSSPEAIRDHYDRVSSIVSEDPHALSCVELPADTRSKDWANTIAFLERGFSSTPNRKDQLRTSISLWLTARSFLSTPDEVRSLLLKKEEESQ